MKFSTLFAACGALLVSMGYAGSTYAGDVTLYTGAFNILEHTGANVDALFGAEYRFNSIYYGLRPTLGASVDTSGDVYGYGGFNWDLKLDESWTVTPSLMGGAYSHGNGEKLGGTLEFREGVEASYTFTNQQRLGLALTHMSNASIYDRNPGAESVLLTYSIPIK